MRSALSFAERRAGLKYPGDCYGLPGTISAEVAFGRRRMATVRR